MNLDGTFHLPSLKTRLSESPVDKIIFCKEITAAATGVDATVAVPFKEGSMVYGLLLPQFEVGETNAGSIEIKDTDITASVPAAPALVFVVAKGSDVS